MNRTQLKCFLASAGVHLALGAILLIGPAFLMTSRTANDLPPLDLIPAKLVDDLVFNAGAAGNPGPAPTTPRPTPAPPAPAATPTPSPPVTQPPEPKLALVEPKPVVKNPPPVIEETPQPPKTKTPAPDETAMEGEKPPPKTVKKPAVVADLTKKIVRGPDDYIEDAKAAARTRQAKERAQARAQAQAAENWRKEVSGALGSIRGGLSSGVTIEPMGTGAGGTGGEAYANYGQAIHSIYDRAWIDPAEVTEESLTVQTVVVIARDGRVISAKISRRSGNNALDKSVDRALQRVRQVPPFPEGAKEDQRSYRIRFNLQAKRSIG